MNSHNTNNNDEYSLLTNIPQEVLGTKKLVKYTNYYRKSKQITISINPTCDTQTESKKQNNTQKEKNHTGVSTFNTNQHRTWKKHENNWRKNHESKSINLTTLSSVSTNFPNPIILWKVKKDESWLIFNYNSIIHNFIILKNIK